MPDATPITEQGGFWVGVGGVVTAALTGIGAIWATFRGDRRKERGDEIAEYKSIIKDLREDLTKVKGEQADTRDSLTECLLDRTRLRGQVEWLKSVVKQVHGMEPPVDLDEQSIKGLPNGPHPGC